MDLQTSCLTLALSTIQEIGLKTPCEPEDLCTRLNARGYPNILQAVPMKGRITGYCERRADGRYILLYDSMGTREQQVRDICHEVTHMIAGHTTTGLICARANTLSDPREREAETTADWFVILLSLPDVSRYDTTDFRLIMERINHGTGPRQRPWRRSLRWPMGRE